MYFKMNSKNKNSGISIAEDEIQHFEKKYLLSLPDDYKNFLLDTNGGKTSDDIIFEIADPCYGGFASIYFDSLKGIEAWISQIIDNEYDDIGHILIKNKVICIGSASSTGLPIGIVADKNVGEIGVIDYELLYDEPFVKVSNSFTEFINSFKPYPYSQ